MSCRGDEAYRYAIEEVEKAYSNTPDGDKLLEKITHSFEKHFNNPPLHDFEVILQKNFTTEEIRCALFKPTDEQIRYYPIILHVTRNLPDNQASERRTRSIALSLIYLVHRKSWPFLQEFIVRGGLYELSSMTNDTNLYYRGQVFEILLSITDCDSFDWFQPPDENTIARILHSRLMGLSENSEFLSGLLANRKKSYPGGSLRALQLLAFWISWVRALMTKNQVLYLSDVMLKELKCWADGDGEDLIEDEIALAATIYQDFSHDQFHRDEQSISHSDEVNPPTLSDAKLPNHPPDNNGEAVSSSGSEKSLIYVSGFKVPDVRDCYPEGMSSPSADLGTVSMSGILGVNDFDAADNVVNGGVEIEPVVEVASSISTSIEGGVARSVSVKRPDEISLGTAQELKTEGNVLFKLSKYKESLNLYASAMAAVDPLHTQHCADTNHELTSLSDSDDELASFRSETRMLKVSLHYNIATVYWKLSELCDLGADDSTPVPASLEVLCEAACRSALAMDPTHAKCAFRLSEVLLKQKRAAEALRAIEQFGELRSLDGTVKALRRRCLAAVLAAAHTNSNTSSANSATEQGEVTDSTQGQAGMPSSSSGEVCVRAASSIAAATVGPQAAKVLLALQGRALRERAKCTHAYNGELLPSDADSLGVGDVTIDIDHTEDINTADKSDDEEAHCPDEESDGVLKVSKNSATKKVRKKSKKELKNESAKNGKGKEEKLSKSKLKSKGVTSDAAALYNKLKQQSVLFENTFAQTLDLEKTILTEAMSNMNIMFEDEVVCLERNSVLEALYDVMDGCVKSSVKALLSIWNESFTLKKLMTASIEPEMLHLLLTIAVKCSANSSDGYSLNLISNSQIAIKILRQLIFVDRFETIFHLTSYGNEKLKCCLNRAVDVLLRTLESERRSLTDTLKVDFNSVENVKERKKSQIDIEKNIDAISKIRTLLI